MAPRVHMAIGPSSKNLLEICSQVAHWTGLVHHRTGNKDGYSGILTEAFQVRLAPDYHMSTTC
jgi:hypothetical protein